METGRTAMRQLALVASAVVVASTLNVRTVSAQRSNFALVDEAAPAQHAGWIFTPSLAYQGAWDDNALLLYEPQPLQFSQLRGGHSNGASASLKHELNDLTSLVASYNFQHAYVTNGGTFDVVNADVGFERQLLPATRVFGAFGFSRLGVSENA